MASRRRYSCSYWCSPLRRDLVNLRRILMCSSELISFLGVYVGCVCTLLKKVCVECIDLRRIFMCSRELISFLCAFCVCCV